MHDKEGDAAARLRNAAARAAARLRAATRLRVAAAGPAAPPRAAAAARAAANSAAVCVRVIVSDALPSLRPGLVATISTPLSPTSSLTVAVHWVPRTFAEFPFALTRAPDVTVPRSSTSDALIFAG